MKQSIKIDIIYFGVDRDTKMEFCFNDFKAMPVRTLATSVQNREEFLYALKRGVYRSDTVIVVGGLWGSLYIPSVIGAAIGSPCEKVDYRAMGFAEPQRPLVFPKGSIPLVTSDNNIGGMLLEKGRQSIIVLTEETNVRHSLLNDLIYPYIFDVCEEDGEVQIADPMAEMAVGAPTEAVTPVAIPAGESAEEIAEIEEPIVTEPVEEASVEEVPVVTQPVIEEPVVEEPVIEEEPIAEEAIVEEVEIAEQPEIAEPATAPDDDSMPCVVDGMFVIVDDGSDEDDELEVAEPATQFGGYTTPVVEQVYEMTDFAGFEPEEEYPEPEEMLYKPRVPVGKIVGVAMAVLCIGASAAIFMLLVLGIL